MADDAGGAPDRFEVLLRVQDLDTAIAQLRHRREHLSERGERRAVDAELAELATRVAEVEAVSGQLADRQTGLESQISSMGARSKTIEDHMFGDKGTAARDLQAMGEEVRHLAARRRQLEDEELEVMEEQEPVDAELTELVLRRSSLEARAEALGSALAVAEAEVDAELAERSAARAAEAALLPPDLADRYERLRARLGGVGAARLVGDRCGGCHLALPSVELDRIRHLPPDQIVTCDQCGRILVREGHRPATGPSATGPSATGPSAAGSRF